MSFSLSSQINNLQRKSSIWAPLNGRVDDFLQSHQLWIFEVFFDKLYRQPDPANQ